MMGSTTSMYARGVVVALCNKYGVITPQMAVDAGLDRKALDRLAHPRYGLLERLPEAKGLYVYRGSARADDSHEGIRYWRKAPKGAFICGPSAAAINKLLPPPPFLWIGLPAKSRKGLWYPNFRYRHFSDQRMRSGIVERDGGGTRYSCPARAVAETFAVRGPDVDELSPRIALARFRELHPGEDNDEQLMFFGHLLGVFIEMMTAFENPLAPDLMPEFPIKKAG